MSWRYVLLVMALAIGSTFITSRIHTDIRENAKLLWTGSWAIGTISECDVRIESRSSGGTRSSRKRTRAKVYIPVAKTDIEDFSVDGSSVFNQQWCLKNIGSKVPILHSKKHGKIALFSQFFGPTLALLILLLNLLLQYISRAATEILVIVTWGVAILILVVEYFLWHAIA